MVFNLIIWIAFLMSLLITASLYFSYTKLRIPYRGMRHFIYGQVLISVGFVLIWFLNETIRFYMTPMIGIVILSGVFVFSRSISKFSKSDVKPIDLYVILPVSFIIYNYFLYIDEKLNFQIVTLYTVLIYMYARAVITVYLRRDAIEDKTHLLTLTMTLFSGLYLFRVLHSWMTLQDLITYLELKDNQAITVIFTFLLQILLTFIVSNLIYTRARVEIKKINSGFHHSPVSMLMLDEDKKVVDVNTRFTDFLGYKVEELLGSQVCDLKMFKEICHLSEFKHMMQSNNPYHNVEYSILKSDGSIIRTLTSISVINYVDQKHSIITFTDISNLHQMNEQLTDYAYYDDLTTLPNRRYLSRLIDSKITDNKRFALMCIDLDNFKHINDNHGHTVGDEVLHQLAKRLLKTIHEEDFVARYAGDEFIIILSLENNSHTLEHKIDNIIDAIESQIYLDNKVFNLKASIGLSEYPLHGLTLNDLLRQADTEMYRIKRMVKSRGLNN
ncbi:sensor domain-containing diguanylate cyclase [Acholeplasma laidlawii]|uniref:sensor domain-containing diguanylate cyclase n=1 Tax=Acholeplasma laidlawii TaxID=2148 RepID=UPI000DA3DB21|nr:sensor domain-containing diguanylate cyclase [Acholeplasma laidlawii]RED20495.1 PAS domain S-box-containing protein/diguanylate cyclase (GGDEF)-like protein [Acholeplasma laidlawii]SQH57006.1 Cyclic di-GMP phosphodiesterase Gmr [Acholeplasma laidlawii]